MVYYWGSRGTTYCAMSKLAVLVTFQIYFHLQMKTVLGLVNFVAAIMSASLNLYFYLTHGDMDKGLIEAIEVTQMMSDYTPLEYALHGLVFVTSLILQ